MNSSQANRRERLHGRHTRLTTLPSPYPVRRQNSSSQYQFRISDPVVHDSAAADVAAAYNQAAAIMSPTPMAIPRVCLNLMACTLMPTGEPGLSLRRN
jgi:hypothetical protein